MDIRNSHRLQAFVCPTPGTQAAAGALGQTKPAHFETLHVQWSEIATVAGDQGSSQAQHTSLNSLQTFMTGDSAVSLQALLR